MKRRPRRRIALPAALLVSGLLVGLLGLTAGSAVLHPRIDSPERVDAIIVVAGAIDDRYVYASHLAEKGLSERILVSRPSNFTGAYASTIDSYCATTPLVARDGRLIDIECFTPSLNNTEGEAVSAASIATVRGWNSLLVVTYWGHVSRVRMYFERCFAGDISVTDTPRPLSKARKDALLHETGGYVKALLKPGC